MSAPRTVDLAQCDREPIHIPGSIQPHGILFGLRAADLRIDYASANAAKVIGAELRGRPLAEAVPAFSDLMESLAANSASRLPVYLGNVSFGPQRYQALVHCSGDVVVLELEETTFDGEFRFQQLQPLVWRFISRLQQVSSLADLTSIAAAEVRAITGFDRVLVYRFDSDWHGTVIAEDRSDRLPSYLDLRFPASDIPAQARELYRLNRIRLIADANYEPVPILRAPDVPDSPLDLSYAALRSVSPVHVEYMKNMGTLASMSISILHEGSLWGLISCHHATPRHPGFDVRTACDLAGQVLSLQLSGRTNREVFEARLRAKTTHSELLAFMAQEERFVDGMVRHPDQLLSLVDAAGAAVLFGGECVLVGKTPDEVQVRAIVDWLAGSEAGPVYHTDSLGAEFPQAGDYVECASGLLAVSISELHRSYVLWFRPEVIQTVKWGGDPRKPVEDDSMRIHPRKSFDMWKETVRRKARPWAESDIEAVADLRNAIVGIVLRKAEELAGINAELERSNRELEAFSYSVSHDLRAPFRHIVGYSELVRELEGDTLTDTGKRYLDTIIESAQYAGTLVDNLLTFSQIGRTTLTRVPVDMNVIVREVLRRLEHDAAGREILFRVDTLPPVEADPNLLRMAVTNLLSNAIKYTRTREQAIVEVGSETDEKEIIFWVKDNGVGFEMAYVDKLFGVFQRLHRMEEFEGTGIGLANVRRIIARHGGRTWAQGEPDAGATFYFSLPRPAGGRP